MIFIVANALLHGFLAYLGLPWVFPGLVYEAIVCRFVRRPWAMVLSAVAGIVVGAMLYPHGRMDALAFAAVLMVVLFHGGLTLLVVTLLGKK